MDDWITLARLVRPRGNRGELIAEPMSNRRERFAALEKVTVFPAGRPEGEGRAHVVESSWWHGERLVLKFRGIDSIAGAEALRGAAVCVPLSERAKLPDGEYYLDDLVGLRVVERETGAELGRVTGWQELGGPPLMVVGGPDGEVLIPFAASICVAIEPEAGRIVVNLPEGLRELNRP
jgi:16S rRNA processing protein RimM